MVVAFDLVHVLFSKVGELLDLGLDYLEKVILPLLSDIYVLEERMPLLLQLIEEISDVVQHPILHNSHLLEAPRPKTFISVLTFRTPILKIGLFNLSFSPLELAYRLLN